MHRSVNRWTSSYNSHRHGKTAYARCGQVGDCGCAAAHDKHHRHRCQESHDQAGRLSTLVYIMVSIHDRLSCCDAGSASWLRPISGSLTGHGQWSSEACCGACGELFPQCDGSCMLVIHAVAVAGDFQVDSDLGPVVDFDLIHRG